MGGSCSFGQHKQSQSGRMMGSRRPQFGASNSINTPFHPSDRLGMRQSSASGQLIGSTWDCMKKPSSFPQESDLAVGAIIGCERCSISSSEKKQCTCQNSDRIYDEMLRMYAIGKYFLANEIGELGNQSKKKWESYLREGQIRYEASQLSSCSSGCNTTTITLNSNHASINKNNNNRKCTRDNDVIERYLEMNIIHGKESKLTRFLMKGKVPLEHRWSAWKAKMKVAQVYKKDLYAALAQKVCVCEKDILKDIGRAFQDQLYFSDEQQQQSAIPIPLATATTTTTTTTTTTSTPNQKRIMDIVQKETLQRDQSRTPFRIDGNPDEIITNNVDKRNVADMNEQNEKGSQKNMNNLKGDGLVEDHSEQCEQKKNQCNGNESQTRYVSSDLNKQMYSGQQQLQRVLRALSHYFPDLKYTQGMNVVVGFFLLVSGGNEEDSFWMFVRFAMSESFLVLGLYECSFPLIDFAKFLFNVKLRELLPDVYAHIRDELGISYEEWFFQWTLTLFLDKFALANAVRFWDYMISEQSFFSFLKLSLAILKEKASALLSVNYGEFHDILFALKTDSSLLDVNRIISGAKKIHLSPEFIAMQTNEYFNSKDTFLFTMNQTEKGNIYANYFGMLAGTPNRYSKNDLISPKVQLDSSIAQRIISSDKLASILHEWRAEQSMIIRQKKLVAATTNCTDTGTATGTATEELQTGNKSEQEDNNELKVVREPMIDAISYALDKPIPQRRYHYKKKTATINNASMKAGVPAQTTGGVVANTSDSENERCNQEEENRKTNSKISHGTGEVQVQNSISQSKAPIKLPPIKKIHQPDDSNKPAENKLKTVMSTERNATNILLNQPQPESALSPREKEMTILQNFQVVTNLDCVEQSSISTPSSSSSTANAVAEKVKTPNMRQYVPRSSSTAAAAKSRIPLNHYFHDDLSYQPGKHHQQQQLQHHLMKSKNISKKVVATRSVSQKSRRLPTTVAKSTSQLFRKSNQQIREEPIVVNADQEVNKQQQKEENSNSYEEIIIVDQVKEEEDDTFSEFEQIQHANENDEGTVQRINQMDKVQLSNRQSILAATEDDDFNFDQIAVAQNKVEESSYKQQIHSIPRRNSSSNSNSISPKQLLPTPKYSSSSSSSRSPSSSSSSSKILRLDDSSENETKEKTPKIPLSQPYKSRQKIKFKQGTQNSAFQQPKSPSKFVSPLRQLGEFQQSENNNNVSPFIEENREPHQFKLELNQLKEEKEQQQQEQLQQQMQLKEQGAVAAAAGSEVNSETRINSIPLIESHSLTGSQNTIEDSNPRNQDVSKELAEDELSQQQPLEEIEKEPQQNRRMTLQNLLRQQLSNNEKVNVTQKQTNEHIPLQQTPVNSANNLQSYQSNNLVLSPSKQLRSFSDAHNSFSKSQGMVVLSQNKLNVTQQTNEKTNQINIQEQQQQQQTYQTVSVFKLHESSKTKVSSQSSSQKEKQEVSNGVRMAESKDTSSKVKHSIGDLLASLSASKSMQSGLYDMRYERQMAENTIRVTPPTINTATATAATSTFASPSSNSNSSICPPTPSSQIETPRSQFAGTATVISGSHLRLPTPPSQVVLSETGEFLESSSYLEKATSALKNKMSIQAITTSTAIPQSAAVNVTKNSNNNILPTAATLTPISKTTLEIHESATSKTRPLQRTLNNNSHSKSTTAFNSQTQHQQSQQQQQSLTSNSIKRRVYVPIPQSTPKTERIDMNNNPVRPTESPFTNFNEATIQSINPPFSSQIPSSLTANRATGVTPSTSAALHAASLNRRSSASSCSNNNNNSSNSKINHLNHWSNEKQQQGLHSHQQHSHSNNNNNNSLSFANQSHSQNKLKTPSQQQQQFPTINRFSPNKSHHILPSNDTIKADRINNFITINTDKSSLQQSQTTTMSSITSPLQPLHQQRLLMQIEEEDDTVIKLIDGDDTEGIQPFSSQDQSVKSISSSSLSQFTPIHFEATEKSEPKQQQPNTLPIGLNRMRFSSESLRLKTTSMTLMQQKSPQKVPTRKVFDIPSLSNINND